MLQQYNTAEPRPEQVRILLESLGGRIKEPNAGKALGSDINFLELAEPNK